MPMDSKIAPRDLIQADFRNLRGNERLDTTPRNEEMIFIQSMEGRAHNGAGAFHKRFFVNTTIDDIVVALDKDPKQIRERRQVLIDEIYDFVKRVIAGEHLNRLVSRKGTPLLGIPLFKTKVIRPRDVVKGIYMGGLRDSPETRSAAEKEYDITIGYGRCYLVNTDVMQRMGLDGESLAHQGHEQELEAFKEQGLIVAPENIHTVGEDKIRYLYIRHKLGPGQSDDAALINGGLLHKSVDVALGVFLADSIDTLEKYAPFYSDQDYELALFIKENYKELDATDDEVLELTYLSAIPEGMEEEVPDSSLRYFLTIDPRTGQTSLESHLNFIEGKPFFPMAISYKRILITTFYEYIRNRLAEVRRPDEFIKLTAIKELDIPIKELIKRKVIVVSGDKILGDALKELREKDADVIIVRDDKQNILGVVDSTDFLHILDVLERKSKG